MYTSIFVHFLNWRVHLKKKVVFLSNRYIILSYYYQINQIDEVHVPYARLYISQNAPNFMDPKLFNKFSIEFKKYGNIIYKNHLKMFLLEQYF